MNSNYRSSDTDVLCKKSAFKNFAKFTGKHLCRVSLQLYQKRHFSTGVFRRSFLRTPFFRTPPVTVSEIITGT